MPSAAADTLQLSKRMRFAEYRGDLVVTTSFPELLTPRQRSALSSGFPTSVIIRLHVYQRGHDLPVSFSVASVRAVYDLWDETYTVQVRGPRGTRTHRTSDRADVIARLTRLDRFPIAALGEIDIGPHYFVAAIVELNPVSEEVLARVRRWLTKPAADRRTDSSSSFFGSFVSVFVNPRLQAAERVVTISSQPFYRVRRR